MAPELRPGDWLCPSCNDVQFARRSSCRRCNTSKPAGVDDDNNDRTCVVCMANVRNAAFVHGEDSHVICCIECAAEIFKQGKSCPLCKRTIERVLKIFL